MAVVDPRHFNVESEQILIGSILERPAIFYEVMNDLSSLDFYDARHAALFRSISALASRGAGVFSTSGLRDFVHKGDDRGEVVKISDAYLDDLMSVALGEADAKACAATVVQLARKRRARAALMRGVARLDALPADRLLTDELDEISADVSVAAQADSGSCKTLGQWAAMSYKRIDDVFFGRVTTPLLTWPLTSLNDICGPATPGDCAVLAGRSSMGKTALALQCCEHFGEQAPGAFFSLEMGGMKIANRSMAALANIAGWRLSRHEIKDQDQLEALSQTIEALAKLPVYVEEKPRLTARQIRAKAIGLRHRKGIRWMGVDHLQIIQRENGRDQKGDTIDDACQIFQALAKELGIFVFMLSQLNSQGRDRAHDRPQMRDMMYFNSIEPHVDLAVFPYRPEVALAERQPSDRDELAFDTWQKQMKDIEGQAEMIVGKSRHGRGMRAAGCRWRSHLMRFEDSTSRPALTNRDQVELKYGDDELKVI